MSHLLYPNKPVSDTNPPLCDHCDCRIPGYAGFFMPCAFLCGRTDCLKCGKPMEKCGGSSGTCGECREEQRLLIARLRKHEQEQTEAEIMLDSAQQAVSEHQLQCTIQSTACDECERLTAQLERAYEAADAAGVTP